MSILSLYTIFMCELAAVALWHSCDLFKVLFGWGCTSTSSLFWESTSTAFVCVCAQRVTLDRASFSYAVNCLLGSVLFLFQDSCREVFYILFLTRSNSVWEAIFSEPSLITPAENSVSLWSLRSMCLYSLTTNLAINHANCFVLCIYCCLDLLFKLRLDFPGVMFFFWLLCKILEKRRLSITLRMVISKLFLFIPRAMTQTL